MGLLNSNSLNEWASGIPDRAREMYAGLLDAPRQVKQLFDPKFQQGLLASNAGKPFDKQKAMAMALEATGMAPMGMAGHIVYHGSPHKFNKFDMSKIGTGEGAQAYGHGLYFAESPAVATDYATKLSSAGLAKNKLAQYGGDIDAAVTAANERIANYKNLIANGGGGDPRRAQGMLNLAEKDLNDLLAMKSGTLNEAGNLYKVDIPDESIPRMLDWDKPLSEQSPEVQAALANTKNKQLRAMVDYASSPYSTPELAGEVKTMGEAIKLMGMNASPAKGSALLAKHGILGIRYLDGMSRGSGQGSSNYVLFDDQLARILEVNGQPTGLLPWGKK